MLTVNMLEAKTNLLKLIEQTVKSGAPFIIARAGKPLVKVSAIEAAPSKPVKRIGFMEGRAIVPDDFSTMMADEIAEMFSPDAP